MEALVGLAVIVIAPALWMVFCGFSRLNLSPFLALWIGSAAATRVVYGKHRRFFLAVSSLFLCLGIVEVGVLEYQRLLKPPAKRYSYQSDAAPGWIAEHSLVGYAFRGPVDLLASATIGDEVIYNSVPYRIDYLSRRRCGEDPRATRHALFFGGSYAFGEGLTNNETLGCQFQTLSEGLYESTTVAMMGWGPGQALVQLGVDALFADIEQHSGVAVFSFISDHIYRTTWKIDTASEFPEYPFFSLDANGNLQGPVNAAVEKRLRVAREIYRFMRDFSPTFRNWVNPSWLRLTSDKEAVITTAKVLAAASDRYRSRFDGEFIVLLWPRSRLAPDLEHLLVGELSTRGVRVVTVPPLNGNGAEAQLHRLDAHPSSAETTWVARRLLDALTSEKH